MSGAEPFAAAGVRGFLHRAAGKAERGLVLTHGAGGNCAMPLLVAAATALAAAGFDVLRCDLPFRQRRPTGPPSPSGAAADREGLYLAVEAMRGLGSRRVVLGGQSYGGRQATMLAADRPNLVAGLLLFSFPLHPPGKPDRLRKDHFARLRVPCVFVQGANDPFGAPAELAEAIRLIPALTEMIPVDGAGHDLKRGRIDLASVVAAVSRQTSSASD
ncbi:MAG: alpha/beta fold hydrolase [Stellaceae bacterium]